MSQTKFTVRKGLATEVDAEHYRNLAKKKACIKISLDVDSKNLSAIAIYNKFGFEISEKSKNSKIHKMVKKIKND